MVKVAVAQMVSEIDLQTNMKVAGDLIKEAAEQGAELVLLPENFAVLESSSLIEIARDEQESGYIHKLLSAWAESYGIWIVAGSMPIVASPDEGKVFAASVVFNGEGQVVARYNKVHLFDVDVADKHSSYRESDYMTPGTELEVVDTICGSMGLSICYDLRFPEQYQKLRDMGADVISVPAAFTYVTGEAHWELLLRARAVETQCYVLAANQGGEHSASRSTWGHSMIIDPWGRVLAEKKEPGPGIVLATIDLEYLRQCRSNMPLQVHRNQVGF